MAPSTSSDETTRPINSPTFYDQDKVAHTDTRPWAQRGFEEVKPVSARANESFFNERKIEPETDGTPMGYPDRQGQQPDTAVSKASKRTA